MKCQMCWEALESLAPNISLKACAIFRAQALRAVLSVAVGGGFPLRFPLAWLHRCPGELAAPERAQLLCWCQLDRQPAQSSTWHPHSHPGAIPHRGSLPQADLPPPEQTDRQNLLLGSPVLSTIPRNRTGLLCLKTAPGLQ